MAIIYLRKQDMTHNVDKAVDNSDVAENGVVVTEAMIEAGVYVAREHTLGTDLGDLVSSVFSIMYAVHQEQ